MKVLIIDKGVSFSQKQYLRKRSEEGLIHTKLIVVPEPTSSNVDYDSDEDFSQGMKLLSAALDEFQPDVLLCSSRGGKYACKLIEKSVWKGPTLMLSAMMIQGSVDYESIESALVCAYGKNEKTVPVAMMNQVRMCKNNKVLAIMYPSDDHSLNSIVSETEQQHGCENVNEMVRTYSMECDDRVFEKKQLSLMELLHVTVQTGGIEKKTITKLSQGLAENIGGQMKLSPSMLKGGLNQLRKQ